MDLVSALGLLVVVVVLVLLLQFLNRWGRPPAAVAEERKVRFWGAQPFFSLLSGGNLPDPPKEIGKVYSHDENDPVSQDYSDPSDDMAP